MRLFLCGDVMTGRGIDQILPHPGDPILFESYVSSALRYVELAERASGPIPRSVPLGYIWGDTLEALDSRSPDLRIVNLETSITADGVPEAKGINYRMHPENIGCLTSAKIDCCVLANNHVADWGLSAMEQTVRHIAGAGMASAGAGDDGEAAARPAILRGPLGRRVLVFALGCASAGVPSHWAAAGRRPGVNFLPDLGQVALGRLGREIATWREPGDVVILSIHWGPNWGYDIPEAHRRFARALIDEAGVDLVHGHSSHHPLGLEVYRKKLILYGCGDFINDYEGIRGHEALKPELALGYFVDFDECGDLRERFEMVPFRRRKFRLERASSQDTAWLAEVLDRESLSCRIALSQGDVLTGINAGG